jgi:hypothetical protein
VFTTSKHGTFPIYHPDSDLHILDIEKGEHRRMALNSDRADTWHAWSGNGRWLIFSSKRMDNLFSRPFVSYIDESGRSGKPFVVPQEDPAFYDSFLKTFNVPELTAGPVTVSEQEWARAIRTPPERTIQADFAASASDPLPEIFTEEGGEEPAYSHPGESAF